MEEYLDIVDDKGEKTGESRSYNEVHKDGLLHRTVHVWFLNSERKLLLQKRSPNKRAYPDHWDISAAGHVSAGQTSKEAAQRETEEELGISLPQSAFQYLFTVKEHTVLNNGTYVNDEFQDVYLVRLDIKPQELKLPADEVSEIKWLGIEELKLWLKGGGEILVPHEEEYRRLLERIEV